MKWWIYCLLATAAAAQQPAPEQLESGVLEGRVIHGVSREPVRKAHVTLELSGPGHDSAFVATTDSFGHFRFAEVKPGTYKMTAAKTGFLESQYGADEPESEGSLLQVSGGSLISNLALRLFPGGVISGRILDADGEPATTNQVVLWRQWRSRKGMPTFYREQTAMNGAGEYRFDGLPAGTYYIHADVGTWGDVTRQIPVDGEGKTTKIHDLPTFYPAALSLTEALPVRLQNGQEQNDVDIRIQRAPTFSVRGKITGMSGLPSSYSVSADVDKGMSWTAEQGKILPNGDFIFDELPPGKHRLHLLKQNGNGVQILGQTEVDLTNQDVIGAVITPFKPARVRVQVIQEGEGNSLTAGSAFLMPTENNEDQRRNEVQYSPQDGFYLFPNVTPGQYQVWFNNAISCYLKSTQVGGQRLATNKVDVAEAANLDVLLIFSKNVAAIRGEVEMPQDQKTHSVHVVLVAENPLWELNRTVGLPLDQFFHFAKANMSPGRYTAFATEDNLDFWDNAEFVKLLESKGARMELQEKQQATFHLKLIAKEETDRVRQQLGL